MYSIYFLLFFLSVEAVEFWIYRKSVLCTYNFKQKYPEDKNDYDTTVGFFNSSYIHYCRPEEVLIDNISYIINYDENGAGDFPELVRVEFPPPKKECMYGVALLVNPSIQNEEECFEHEFDTYQNWKIHGIEKNMCVFKYDNPFVKNEDNSTEFLYKDRIGVWFRHIFRGCYALRFHINHKSKYVMSNPVFFNTTYQQTEVMPSKLICRYKAHSKPEERQMTNFTLDIYILPDTGAFLQVALISQENKDLRKGCFWRTEPFLFVWLIDLGVNSAMKELSDQYCDVKFVKTTKGHYRKSVRCNFQLEVEAASSCFVYNLIDDRCKKNTVWKPPLAIDTTPCLWVSHCEQTFENGQHVETVKPRTLMQSDTVLNPSSYLLLPIIAIVLIISAVIGILCFRRYLHIRKEEINLYVNPQHDDSNCLKSPESGIIDNGQKKIGHDNSSCDNIVLLYTNSSTSFMALMKDFRKTLAKMCSCSVHDWHDGAVWNEVAKVGAVSWFTELLDNGCRVIWIDTLATRSAVISNSRDDESSSDKLNKYYEIHDFRDMAFRVVLEVAKSKVNDGVARQYRRHFVVRFEGLESMANMDDPFLDLSPHARYYMPQHLMQLCSDLSVMKSEISKCKTKIDEDVYRIFVYQLYKSQTQQRLKSMKMDSTM